MSMHSDQLSKETWSEPRDQESYNDWGEVRHIAFKEAQRGAHRDYSKRLNDHSQRHSQTGSQRAHRPLTDRLTEALTEARP